MRLISQAALSRCFELLFEDECVPNVSKTENENYISMYARVWRSHYVFGVQECPAQKKYGLIIDSIVRLPKFAHLVFIKRYQFRGNLLPSIT